MKIASAYCTARPHRRTAGESMHQGEVLRRKFRGTDRVGDVAEVSLGGFNKMHIEALDRLSR